MKRNLLLLAVVGALANVAHADATLNGDDTYAEVHGVPATHETIDRARAAAQDSALSAKAPYGGQEPGGYYLAP